MYQSISVRVLRQAMDWMAIPSPWFRTVSAFTFPNGDYSSTVKCMWNYHEIIEAIDDYAIERHPVEESEYIWSTADILRQMLEEAFCEDIQVVSCQELSADRLFVAYLSCKIARQPDSAIRARPRTS